MDRLSKLIVAMTEYFLSDKKRINHYIKVHEYAKTIAVLESVPNV